tara:strand:- start:89 stop:253 length:165 start_codon:yes stop_codon:yes gene_type:complete
LRKFEIEFKSTLNVIAEGHNEAKKIAEDQVKFIHPKWNMEFKSMTFKELVGEEE